MSARTASRRLSALACHLAATPAATTEPAPPSHFDGTHQVMLDQGTQQRGTGGTPREAREATVEVCCIGAGISGIVTAVELADAGCDDVLIIEKGDDVSTPATLQLLA